MYLKASVHTKGYRQLKVRSRSAHGLLTVSSRLKMYLLHVFKGVCSYERSRSAHGLFMVSSGLKLYRLPVFKYACSYERSRIAHGLLTVNSRLKLYLLRVFKYVCSYECSRSANGRLTVSSRLGNVPFAFKCVGSYQRSRSFRELLKWRRIFPNKIFDKASTAKSLSVKFLNTFLAENGMR